MDRGRGDETGRKPGCCDAQYRHYTRFRSRAPGNLTAPGGGTVAPLRLRRPPRCIHASVSAHAAISPGGFRMLAHPSANLRTLAFVGHAGVGKTTLIEALLAASGALTSAGSIERGNTVCDYDPLEKEHGHSLKVACAHFERDGVRVHLLDTPGYPDFAGRAMAALDAVESVGVVVSAQHGIELSAARMALWAQTRRLCRFIVVNRIDADEVDLPARVDELRAAFGQECLPVNLPTGGGRAVDDVLKTEFGLPMGLADTS